jgi:hypothetical protein
MLYLYPPPLCQRVIWTYLMHSEVYCRLSFHLNSIFKTSIIYKTIKNLQSNQSCEFEPSSWRGVFDTTLYDKACQ